MVKHVSRIPNERLGESLMDWEERELIKKARKLGIRLRPVKKKRTAPKPSAAKGR
jgi:hypothetical protein